MGPLYVMGPLYWSQAVRRTRSVLVPFTVLVCLFHGMFIYCSHRQYLTARCDALTRMIGYFCRAFIPIGCRVAIVAFLAQGPLASVA